jgi:hypothetical protein
MSAPEPDRNDTPLLGALEVLYEEYREAGGDVSKLEPARRQYLFARETGENLDSAESEFRDRLFAEFHRAKRSALCFSGGGIRSATFGLGVLEGLARWSAAPAGGARPKLLGEFDFLSTVSGGGYLGGWLSAWAARLERSIPDGFREVIHRLAERPASGFDPDPPPIRHLRQFSNYLTPRLGFLSGDTWALVATVVRNIFLNWLVLLPLLAAALLAPELALRLASIPPAQVSSGGLWFLIVSAFLAGAVATAYVGFDLPSAGNARRNYLYYLGYCLLPMTYAAIQMTTFWAWLPLGHHNSAVWDVVSLGRDRLTAAHFAIFGALMHGGGMLAGIALARFHFRRPTKRKGLIASAAALLTGAAAGAAGYSVSSLAGWKADESLANPTLYVCLAFPTVMSLFMGASALLVGGTSYITEDQDREWWSRSGGWFLVITLAWPLLAALVLYSGPMLDWASMKFTGAFAALTGAAGWATSQVGHSAKTPSRHSNEEPEGSSRILGLLSQALLPVFLCLLVLLLAAFNDDLTNFLNARMPSIPSFWPSILKPMGDATAPTLWLLVVYMAVCFTASYFINVNKFSLHAMYRQRLIRAYLGASNTGRCPHPFTGFDPADNLSMCELNRSKPLHVVNMALNLVKGENLAWQQRKAASFTSTRLHTGSCRVGYRSSRAYGGAYRAGKTPISLGTAITISGAAASPNMGYNSSTLLSIVMTLFNARLGWWLGNPRANPEVWQRPGPRWGTRPFVDEAFGLTTDTNDWLYLSDGGHFDNLGLYEMVLRRCHTIVVSDAGADPDFTYEDLGNAVRKIRVDLGIPIELATDRMPTSPLEEGENGERLHWGIAHIVYSAVDPGAPNGTLLYLKPCMTGDEPADVAQYAASNERFPHQPTADQFFDEAQFESYRRLGLHTVDAICGAPKQTSHSPENAVDLAGLVARAQARLARGRGAGGA